MLEQVFDGWQGGANASVVAYFAIFGGNIEIHPYQHTFAFDIDISDCLLVKHAVPPE
jgi:hypothetical protein